MTHDEFPFHGFANHYQKKSRRDLPLFSAKKKILPSGGGPCFFLSPQTNRDSRNPPVKLDNMTNDQRNRGGRLQGGFKICHDTL